MDAKKILTNGLRFQYYKVASSVSISVDQMKVNELVIKNLSLSLSEEIKEKIIVESFKETFNDVYRGSVVILNTNDANKVMNTLLELEEENEQLRSALNETTR